MMVTDESSVGSTTESKALPTWSAGMDSRSADRAKSIAEVAVFTYVLSLIWGISLKFGLIQRNSDYVGAYFMGWSDKRGLN